MTFLGKRKSTAVSLYLRDKGNRLIVYAVYNVHKAQLIRPRSTVLLLTNVRN